MVSYPGPPGRFPVPQPPGQGGGSQGPWFPNQGGVSAGGQGLGAEYTGGASGPGQYGGGTTGGQSLGGGTTTQIIGFQNGRPMYDQRSLPGTRPGWGSGGGGVGGAAGSSPQGRVYNEMMNSPGGVGMGGMGRGGGGGEMPWNDAYAQSWFGATGAGERPQTGASVTPMWGNTPIAMGAGGWGDIVDMFQNPSRWPESQFNQPGAGYGRGPGESQFNQPGGGYGRDPNDPGTDPRFNQPGGGYTMPSLGPWNTPPQAQAQTTPPNQSPFHPLA